MPHPTTIRTQLAVLGAGMAGLSAAVFARHKGLSTLVVGGTGELVYASGPWDLLGVHPIAQQQLLIDPWLGIEALKQDLPNHPYARVTESEMRAAFAILLDDFRDARYPYNLYPDSNCEVITSVGTTKRTYCLPHTMWGGVEAYQNRVPCLLVDFEGLKDFSARQTVANLSSTWPDLRARRITFPGAEHLSEVSVEYLARCLDLHATRERLADLIGPHVQDLEAVGFPAVLGYERSLDVMSDLEKWLGIPVFEVPSPPVSVPGMRIKRTFEKVLRGKGAQLLLGSHVLRAEPCEGGLCLHVGPVTEPDRVDYVVRAEGALLATGRFLGGGLAADRTRVRETLFDLPVHQPESRQDWHRSELLDPRGHPINQSGLETDDRFRPLDASGNRAHRALFASGSILAHQDWMRMKCGSGLALASSYAAVNAFDNLTRPSRQEAL